MRKAYHFLGGVYFAALLILIMATAVIIATFIEGHHDSHEAAAEIIYRSPLFNLLLGGFFLNILLSTLRRWPFKKKHLPFITTHIGLLMLIGGTLLKNIYGIQGTMTVVEGSSSKMIRIRESQAIHIDGKSYPIQGHHWFDFKTNEEIKISLAGYLPHAKFRYLSWIKPNGIDILGFPRIHHKTKLHLFNEEYVVEKIKSDNLFESAKIAYLEYLEADFPIDLTWSEQPILNGIPLTGFYRHIDPRYFSPYSGEPLTLLKLKNANRLLFFYNESETLICLIRHDGSIHFQNYSSDKIDSYYSYGGGLGGYSIEASFPKDLFYSLDERIQLIFNEIDPEDEGYLPFLWKWQGKGSWLFEEEDVAIQEAEHFETLAEWSKLLMPHVEESLKLGLDPFIKLEELGWKRPEGFNQLNILHEKMSLVQEQLYQLASTLPPLGIPITKEIAASALYRSLKVSFNTIFPNLKPIETGFYYLESPLGFAMESCDDMLSLPAISFECSKGDVKEKISLSFSESLKWPILGGRHLASFEPHIFEIPYKVRLKQARKVCYPGTNKPSAYEADVLINTTPFTLKMNQVYESDEGYRFYLSSLSDPPTDAKQVVIVVNYDPVRYSLTYPGGLLVVLGAFALFFKRKSL